MIINNKNKTDYSVLFFYTVLPKLYDIIEQINTLVGV